MEIYVKKIYHFNIFSFFLALKHDVIRCVHFTRIVASHTASDNVTSQVTHRILNTDSLYFCAHIVVVEIYENSRYNCGF